MNTIAITPLQKVQREASKILSPDQPAGRGSLAAVEINGFHFIVCDDNELPFSSRLLGQLHVHDRDWPVEHADFLNDDGVDRTAKSEKNIRKDKELINIIICTTHGSNGNTITLHFINSKHE